MNTVTEEVVDGLKGSFAGEIVLPSDGSYDDVRELWNAMIDKRPRVIARCAGTRDVVTALAFARKWGLEIAVRGAGHNIAGNASCDEGIMIDLSNMKTVDVDAPARRAHAQPGATLGDVDAATQEHGLALPTGINSTTGIAGLTLGGGFGWLTRKYGMTIDNLLSAEVVTVDGKVLTASAGENEDLFWAIRGGGGNFGIVTSFEFQLHKVGPDILAGLIVYPFEQAKEVLEQYRAFAKNAPEEANTWVIMRHAPPLPFLPEQVHGKKVVVLAVFYAGDLDEGQRILEPLKSFGSPHGVHVGVQPFCDWQQAFDPLLVPGARNYWKSHNFNELGDEALDKLIEYAAELPTGQCEIFIGLIDGAPNRLPVEETPWVGRDARFVLNVHARWDDAADDDTCIAWARSFFEATKPYASGGGYINFMTEEEGGRVTDAYGANYGRLVALKRKYDPENILHLNQNIKP
jgi:FAD/FMN-containing dehydrogenase